MPKNLFEILPLDFYKPLTSKYRRMYADTILLIYNTFRPEISYGVNREIIVSVLIAALTALGAAIGLNSCNVVRTITNKSEYYQRGDTSVMIQTRTTESYDATKK